MPEYLKISVVVVTALCRLDMTRGNIAIKMAFLFSRDDSEDPVVVLNPYRQGITITILCIKDTMVVRMFWSTGTLDNG